MMFAGKMADAADLHLIQAEFYKALCNIENMPRVLRVL